MIFTVKDATGVEYDRECITKLEDLQLLQDRFIEEWKKQNPRRWNWKPCIIVDFETASIIIYNDWIE